MANKNVLAEKQSVVKEIIDNIDSSASVLIWEYNFLDVATIQKIKRELRKAGAKTKVYKNTLARRAFEEKGYKELVDHFTGPNAFAFSSQEDEVATARIIFKYMNDNKGISLKAGIFEGKVVTENSLNEIATLPSREGLLSMLLSVLQTNTRNLAFVLSQVDEKLLKTTSKTKVEESKLIEN